MKEGEPILGGPQANPGVTSTSNSAPSAPVFGAQLVTSAAPQNITTGGVSPSSLEPQPSANPLPLQPQAVSQPQIGSQSQFASQPISSGTGDMILSGATSKLKKKKIIIISAIIILFITAIFIIIKLITAGPTQKISDDQYDEATRYSQKSSNIVRLINDGINGQLSIYDLLIADRIIENSGFLANDISLSAISLGSNAEDTSSILVDARDALPDLEVFINELTNKNYISNVKNVAQNIQKDLGEYSAVINSFSSTVLQLRQAFISDDYGQEIYNFIYNNSLSSAGIGNFLYFYAVDYHSFDSLLSTCQANREESICLDVASLRNLRHMIRDSQTTQYLLNSLIDENRLSTINKVNSELEQLSNNIRESIYNE